MADLEPQSEATELASRLSLARTEEELENVVRQIADETGARPETLRLALRALKAQEADTGLVASLRRQWARMSSPTKRIVTSAFLGLQASLASALADKFGDKYGFFIIAQIVLAAIGIYNLAIAKRREVGALAGAAFGFSAMVGSAFFSMIIAAPHPVRGALIIPFTLLGALFGFIVSRNYGVIQKLRFQHDPERRREELLKQLIELQDELKQTEQVVTFLSVDVAGSTRIKQSTDPLAAEYTFGEYTNFVTTSAAQFNGTLHSTAGDGILMTFQHPSDAFQAARRIQAGVLEFNTFRNRTGQPFELRCGIHTGAVMAPGKDVSAVAFSHVIDVASHIQRASPLGGIVVTEDAALFLPGGPHSVGSEVVESQGTRGYVWRPTVATQRAISAAAVPPPPPFLS